jgi:hypothetical protein
METTRQPILRTPILLLALVNLAILGMRLWPWQEVMNLPGNGTTGVDPAIALAGYVGLGLWIGTAHEDSSRKALFSAAWLGIVAGLFLVADVVLTTRQAGGDSGAPVDEVQIGLLVCAGIVLGISGLRAARAGFPTGFAAVCAIWASMVACLMAVAAILGETYLSQAQGESSNPWKDYQGLAIGTPAMQSLVHSLDSISGFLLIGPLVGCLAGALFAFFGRRKKT